MPRETIPYKFTKLVDQQPEQYKKRKPLELPTLEERKSHLKMLLTQPTEALVRS